MTPSVAPSTVVRFPPRLRVICSSGLAVENARFPKGVRSISKPKSASGLALDRLLEDGTLDARQHTAALAYAALRRRYDRSGGPMRSWRDRSGLSDEAWQAVKRDHARLIRAAGAERFALDRLCLEGDAPLACEVERIKAALGRVLRLHETLGL